MKRITIIGAGGVIFAQNFMRDILLDSKLRTYEIMLMDIDAQRLETSLTFARLLTEKLNVKANIVSTTNLREAVRGATYVLTIFRSGTLEHQQLEYDIPAKYGVKQVVSDTLGVGGIFRGLRTLKDLFEVLDAMEQECPGAYMLNYVNPMSMNTIALSKRAKTVKVAGLCHSVQHTADTIAKWLNVPNKELTYFAAGVNHQAFMLKLEHNGRDLYPELRECLSKPDIYNTEKVRFELLRHFDFFPTEGSGHGSEYNAYFRKREELIERFCSVTAEPDPEEDIPFSEMSAGVSGASTRICPLLRDRSEREIKEYLSGKREISVEHSNEYGVQIIQAIENNQLIVANLNVMNYGLMPSLPPDACVEVPCLVNGAGILPCKVEEYPEQLAALNRAMINVQLSGAQGALDCDRHAASHVLCVDTCLLYTSPSPRDLSTSRMPSSA
eukprot:TRINITY_DN7721_c0_g1_i12.p3 TRINITY_DN7721_c0_g1~~TRINITY_DN7721_c0_g1_i12.p3  ORF type:complete len:441 (-),score=109.36 TRINITY_DN7721_c0_g1_i12:94-1416(-)